MKVYKVTLMIIDHDRIGEESIVQELANVRYANDCIRPSIMNVESRDIGDWTDDHVLNKQSSVTSEFERLFSTK